MPVSPSQIPLLGIEKNVLVLHTVGVTVAMIVAVIFLRALLLLRRSGETLSGFTWIARLMFLTGVAQILRLLLSWVPISITPPYWLDALAPALGFMTISSMPVILSEYYFAVQPEEGPSSRTWLQWMMRANAALGLGAFLLAVFLGSKTLIWLIPAAACTVAPVLLCSKARVVRNLQIRYRGLFLFTGLTAAALLELPASLIYFHFAGGHVNDTMTLAICMELCVMLLTLGMLSVFANLRLADVTVKRVVHLYLSCVASLLLCAAIQTLVQAQVLVRGTGTEAVFAFATIILATIVLVLTPGAVRRVDRWIEDWLFQLPDFEGAAQHFQQELVKLKHPDEVYRAGELVLFVTLALAAARIVSVTELQETGVTLPLVGPNPPFLPANSPLRMTFIPPADVLSPLFQEGIAEYCIVLSRGVLRPQFSAMDLSFVMHIACHIQTRVDTLLGEQRRLERLQREDSLRGDITEAELRALRAQINPHFLFNSLNSIADLSIEDPIRAEEMTLRLSAVFRYVLVDTDRPFTSVKEEIDFARSYLDIEEARFGDRLRVHFNVDPTLLEKRIPTLLLQPLIENALKHGLSPKREGGTLNISADRISCGFRLIVSDDGIGLPTRAADSFPQHIIGGLENVQRRLQTAYKGHATFMLTPRQGGGTEATVTIKKTGQEFA